MCYCLDKTVNKHIGALLADNVYFLLPLLSNAKMYKGEVRISRKHPLLMFFILRSANFFHQSQSSPQNRTCVLLSLVVMHSLYFALTPWIIYCSPDLLPSSVLSFSVSPSPIRKTIFIDVFPIFIIPTGQGFCCDQDDVQNLYLLTFSCFFVGKKIYQNDFLKSQNFH